ICKRAAISWSFARRSSDNVMVMVCIDTSSKETTIASGEMLTVYARVAQITSTPAWPLRHPLAQRPVPPAAHAHYVEAFPREDDLLDGFLAVIASVFQIVPHFHPAHVAL